jgi:type II secretory pathway pseudopilin PulG
MAVLLFLLAIAGGVLVGDLVLENTAAGSVTVLDRSFTGYSEGQLLAVVAVLGFVVGVLAVASVSLRRTRRARRRQLRTAERDLTAQLTELERENLSLRKQLAYRDPSLRRRGAGDMPADLVTGSTAAAAERRPRSPAPPTDPHDEPVYEEARRVARLRSSDLER